MDLTGQSLRCPLCTAGWDGWPVVGHSKRQRDATGGRRRNIAEGPGHLNACHGPSAKHPVLGGGCWGPTDFVPGPFRDELTPPSTGLSFSPAVPGSRVAPIEGGLEQGYRPLRPWTHQGITVHFYRTCA